MIELHPDDGPPCTYMEDLLQREAEGSLHGLSRWYALAHAARCAHCKTFLDRLRETLDRLHALRNTPESTDALDRLRNGAWRSALSGENDPQSERI
ncbi:MAG: hypothetical protein SFX74_04935 [Fimbriimonadaceae bacterium]|nr:hypothetical protein [Fimbriimonadaceae bacterium]